MVSPVKTALRIVLHEGEGSERLSGGRRAELVRRLLESGYAVTLNGGGALDGGGVAPADSSDLVVLGEVSAAGSAALDTTLPGVVGDGNGANAVQVHFRDIRGVSPDDVVTLVDALRDETQSYASGEWKPWFPVIDFQRCTNCMQCLSFCLFDVYGVDADAKITVKNPDKCKTSCPACSRVCPEVAILFPKYTAGPINGAEINTEDMEREKMKVDISALLGGDIYSLLRERHTKAASRFAKERDEGKALKERLRCLKKLQGELDIPQEVLMSLPSMEEIKAKAATAQRMNAVPDGSPDGQAS